MSCIIPEPAGTEGYTRIPFEFDEETSAIQVFLRLPDNFSPLERMVLQTTGNLQRLLSAYFNVPSRVEIIENELIPTADDAILPSSESDEAVNTLRRSSSRTKVDKLFQRKIHMYFGDKFVYEAESIVAVKDSHLLDLLAKHRYGLGQVFSMIRQTPQFALHSVGRHGTAPGASFWRDYTLSAPNKIHCYIRESFIDGLFEPCTEPATRTGMIWGTQK